MLASSQNYTIDCVFIQIQQACGGSYTNPLGRVVNDLPDCIGGEM
jgi:hypothetical protein